MNANLADAKRLLAVARLSVGDETKKLALLDSIASSLVAIAEALSEQGSETSDQSSDQAA